MQNSSLLFFSTLFALQTLEFLTGLGRIVVHHRFKNSSHWIAAAATAAAAAVLLLSAILLKLRDFKFRIFRNKFYFIVTPFHLFCSSPGLSSKTETDPISKILTRWVLQRWIKQWKYKKKRVTISRRENSFH